MLIPIKYTGLHGDLVTVNLRPEQIMCVDTVMTSGNPTPNVHVWMVGASDPLFLANAELPVVAGCIDAYYRSIKKYCPFMYITSNVFLNVNYVQFVDRPLIDDKYDDKATTVFMRGPTVRVEVPGKTVAEVTDSINAVLAHVEDRDELV